MTDAQRPRQLPDGLQLQIGTHADWAEGACVMEAAAWLAGEPMTDRAPRGGRQGFRYAALEMETSARQGAIRNRRADRADAVSWSHGLPIYHEQKGAGRAVCRVAPDEWKQVDLG